MFHQTVKVSGTEKRLDQNFTPTISPESSGAYSRDPFSQRQTIERHLHGQRSYIEVVYLTDMTYSTFAITVLKIARSIGVLSF